RSPGIIYNTACSRLVRQSCNTGNIGDLEQGIGWSLDPDQPSAGAQRRLYTGEIGHVHKGGGQTPGLKNLSQQTARTMVGIIGCQYVVAGRERLEHAHRRSRA